MFFEPLQLVHMMQQWMASDTGLGHFLSEDQIHGYFEVVRSKIYDVCFSRYLLFLGIKKGKNKGDRNHLQFEPVSFA